MALFNIQLHHLRFFAAHGLYTEEKLVENEFEVNLSLQVKAPKTKITSIDQTINYARVYELTKEIVTKPEALLETLAMRIADTLRQQFPSLKKISVQVIKLHPPIASFSGSVSVTYSCKFKN